MSSINENKDNDNPLDCIEFDTNWETVPLRGVCSISPSNIDKNSRENEKNVKLCNYTDVYYNDEILFEMDFMSATTSQEKYEKFQLRKGDILLTKDSESKDDIGIPAYVPEDLLNIVCGYHLFLIRPNKERVVPKYLFYALGSKIAQSQFENRANGVTRFGLTTESMSSVKIPLPSKEIQKNISRQISAENQKLQDVVEELEDLKSSINSWQDASRNRLVKSDPSEGADLQETDSTWIGEIPSHWDVGKLSWVTKKIGSGETPDGGSESYVDEGIHFIRSQNVRKSGLSLEDIVYIPEKTHQDMDSTHLMEGDVLLNITGASIGRSCVISEQVLPANVNQHVCILRPDRKHIEPSYLNQVISSSLIQRQIFANQTGASRQAVTFSQIGDFEIPLPPIEEQKEISNILNQKNGIVKQLDSYIDDTINLLEEKRQALVTAAVTGQIDMSEEKGVIQGDD